MANLSEDIQCIGSDTRPPMLERTDFASWQQRIQLYCRGKENGVNILKSTEEGPFQMGMFKETLAEGEEGAFHLGPERPRVYSNLSPKEKDRVDKIEVNGTMHGVQVQLVMREHRIELEMLIKVKQGRLDKMLLMQAQENGVALDKEQLLFISGGQDTIVDEDVDEQPVQDLALNVDNMFQVDGCDAFDSDVDKAPTSQTMFMANLSSADPVYDKANPSYDLDILSEYVKDNEVPVVQSNVSSVPNDAYMMKLNYMHKQPTQHVSVTTQNNIVNKSLTAKLATYKEQVELYERRAKFKLTEREQKIYEQLKTVIIDRNIKEENLKKERHSIKMQLSSTINHNKLMVEEVTSLKKDFKQKEKIP
nr:integrase, catalytic region, zinc finger, CCHC-type, peptidase aspartic, catalytic [Tanacetum cinerariifolium]